MPRREPKPIETMDRLDRLSGPMRDPDADPVVELNRLIKEAYDAGLIDEPTEEAYRLYRIKQMDEEEPMPQSTEDTGAVFGVEGYEPTPIVASAMPKTTSQKQMLEDTRDFIDKRFSKPLPPPDDKKGFLDTAKDLGLVEKKELTKKGPLIKPNTELKPLAPAKPGKPGKTAAKKPSAKKPAAPKEPQYVPDVFDPYRDKLNLLIEEREIEADPMRERSRRMLEAYNRHDAAYSKAIENLKNMKVNPESYWDKMSTTQTVLMGIAAGLQQAGNFISKRPNGVNYVTQMIDAAQKRDTAKQKREYQKQVAMMALTKEQRDHAFDVWNKLQPQIEDAQKDISTLKLLELAAEHPKARLELGEISSRIGYNVQRARKAMLAGLGGKKPKPLKPLKAARLMDLTDEVFMTRTLDNIIADAKTLDKNSNFYIGKKYLPNSTEGRIRRRLLVLAAIFRKSIGGEKGVMTDQDYSMRYKPIVDGKITSLATIIENLEGIRRDVSEKTDLKLDALTASGYYHPFAKTSKSKKQTKRAPGVE